MTEINDRATIALDRASSRTFNDYGHLRVVETNISKAAVNPYVGREIPRSEELGLQPDKIYRLLRHPAEMEKGAASFNGVPLLRTHKPLHAEAHDHALTVGTIGDVRFEPPYLKATLNIWDAAAIRRVQNGSHRELSSAYGYWADMTPGEFEGVAYDGVMRGIHANHVALVSEGRAGPDCIVGDSLERITMAKHALSRAGAHTQGALAVYLMPKLAQDAKIDLGPVVKDLTAKNFKASIPALVLDLKARTKGKLAQDASLDDVGEVIEALAEILPEEVPEVVEEMGGVDGDDALAKDDDGDMRAKLAAAGVPADIIDKVMAALADPVPAMDADKDDAPKDEKDKKPAMDTKHMVTKPAMDAAIAAAVRSATELATRTQRDIREAERAVRPRVGDLAMAHDSAEAVYRTALTTMGVAIDGVPDTALKALFHAIPEAAAQPKPVRVAQDAAAEKSFSDRYGTARIGHAA